MEILNHKIISDIISTCPVTADHSALLQAIADRYPKLDFKLINRGKGSFREGRVLLPDGSEHASDFEEWIVSVTQGRDDLAPGVWRQYHPLRLIRTEYEIESLHLVAPYGPNPEDFFQIDVDLAIEKTFEQISDDPCCQVEDIVDLKTSFEYSTQIDVPVQPPFYRFEKLVDIRRFLNETIALHWAKKEQELPEKMETILTTHIIDPDGGGETLVESFLDKYPNWATDPCSEERLFRDWRDSSPGQRGIRFCDHWICDTYKYQNERGDIEMGLTPRWNPQDGGLDLPEIITNDGTSFEWLADQLSQFDKFVGFPFAWYTYFVYGNMIEGYYTCHRLLEAHFQGYVKIPDCDVAVLQRYIKQPYGF